MPKAKSKPKSQPNLKVWQYTIPSAGLGEGWAYIIIREDGFFSTVSDYGNYAYLWSSTGCDDVRKFFLRSARDWDYFARKLCPKEELDIEATVKNLREGVKELMKDGSREEFEARQVKHLIDDLEGDDDWEGFVREGLVVRFFETPWEYTVRRLNRDVEAYAKKIFPKLVKLIQKELDVEAVSKKDVESP